MAKNIQWGTMLEQTLSRIWAGNKAIFPDTFNPHGNTRFLEAEELISSIEDGIGEMNYDADEFKEAYENLRKEHPEFMDGKKSTTG
ncbi:MAG: hypothetical protein R6X10_12005 [Desulfobacterales bacterium]